MEGYDAILDRRLQQLERATARLELTMRRLEQFGAIAGEEATSTQHALRNVEKRLVAVIDLIESLACRRELFKQCEDLKPEGA